MNNIKIGTSGYSYAYWKNRFYPEGLPASKWLEYYSSRFDTVELNSSFYRIPTIKNLQKAADTTPADFLFSVKANKRITHIKRMRDVKNIVTEFSDIVLQGLGTKLACILYQLPPSYSYAPERLDDILSNITHSGKKVIEFRHVSWWNETVFGALKENNLSFCSVSFPGLPEDNLLTGDTFYKRMHGVPELFKSPYDETALEALAAEIPATASDSFVYFNNTWYEAAYTNAATLIGLCRSK